MRDAADLVAYIAVNLVDHPEAVQVEKTVDGQVETFMLRVHPDDRGKVIGKGGHTANAVRTLLQAFGARNDRRLGFEIIDEEAGQ